MKLLANPAPAPADVVWQNTYLPRSSRMLRAWSITLVIAVLTIFWSILLVPLAGLLSLENIDKVWPQLADALSRHEISRSLIQQGLPTLLISLLGLAVPYIYYCKRCQCSTRYGMLIGPESRAVNSARNDLAGRGRDVVDLEELFLHIFQSLRRIHNLWDSFQCHRILQSHRRISL